jgi:hypothetical protein
VSREPGSRAREVTPIVLAIGLVLAVNVVAFGILWDALYSSEAGISENATQILTTAFGGIIGVLGATLGYKQGTDRADALNDAENQGGAGSAPAARPRGTTMSTTTPDPQDPATDPDRDIDAQPQDPDATQPQSPDTKPQR